MLNNRFSSSTGIQETFIVIILMNARNQPRILYTGAPRAMEQLSANLRPDRISNVQSAYWRICQMCVNCEFMHVKTLIRGAK
jgi:hypothetical protein